MDDFPTDPAFLIILLFSVTILLSLIIFAWFYILKWFHSDIYPIKKFIERKPQLKNLKIIGLMVLVSYIATIVVYLINVQVAILFWLISLLLSMSMGWLSAHLIFAKLNSNYSNRQKDNR